ncbi:MAG TPA: SIS domain-containing protein [Candidatus Limnocylindrales bacterium]
MRDEIGQIPGVVRTILRDGAADTERVAAAVRRGRPRGAVIAARGTSDHAAIYARYLLEGRLRLPTGLAAPSLTTVYGTPLDWRDLLLVGISQSGEGPDIVAVVEAARAGGALTVAITNEPASPLAAAAEFLLPCRAGEERAVAATKTYVAELTAVAALVAAVEVGEERGAASDGHVPPLAADLPRVPDVLEAVLETSAAWLATAEPLVEALAASDRALVVSRGYNLATALEVALKLKETSRIFADGYSSADLLHGPVALAGPAIPTLAFRPDGAMGAALDESLDRARFAGARPWVVGGQEVAAAATSARALALPGALPETLTPLAFVLPGQLVAETVARRRGMDPDAPLGLTKVTRTT